MILDDLLDKVQHGEPIRHQDLSRLVLDGADLAGATFEGVRFPTSMRRAVMKESTFVECAFPDSQLSGADLHLATFYKSSLQGASFEGAQLVGASFIECDCDGARFAGAFAPIASWIKTSLLGASFERANLNRANILEAPAEHASFVEANLEKATLYRADLRTADLTGANLSLTTLVEAMLGAKSFRTNKLFRTQFMKSELAGSTFAGADVVQCNFMGADLRGASFEDARAAQCFFGEASLAKARFDRAILVNAIFEKVAAAGADFTGAVLEEAFFGQAALPGARFVDARLREADFSHADLSAADFTGSGMYRTKLHGSNRGDAVLPPKLLDGWATTRNDGPRRPFDPAMAPRAPMRSDSRATPHETTDEKRGHEMSAAKKLTRIEAYLETGTLVRGAPLEVSLATGSFAATLAKSCFVAPEAGDKVLCAIDGEGVYVLAVLAGRAGAPTKIAATGDLLLEARGGRVSVCGSEGVDVAAAGPVTIAGPEVHVRAQRGTVAVQEMGFFGRLLQAEVGKVALVAREVDSVVTRLSQRAKRVFRFVEEIDQTRAGTVDIRAQSLLGLRAENAVISARVLAKVDGEQIHLG